LLLRDKKNSATKNTSYGAYDISGMLLPKEYYKREPQGAATGGQREYCHRGNIIGGSHKVLPPGAEAEGVLLLKRMPQGSTATGGISYGVYDGGGVLLSGEHYRRKPQGAAIEGGSY